MCIVASCNGGNSVIPTATHIKKERMNKMHCWSGHIQYTCAVCTIEQCIVVGVVHNSIRGTQTTHITYNRNKKKKEEKCTQPLGCHPSIHLSCSHRVYYGHKMMEWLLISRQKLNVTAYKYNLLPSPAHRMAYYKYIFIFLHIYIMHADI